MEIPDRLSDMDSVPDALQGDLVLETEACVDDLIAATGRLAEALSQAAAALARFHLAVMHADNVTNLSDT